MMKTCSQWLAEAAASLTAAGLENSQGEARHLLSFVLGLDRHQLLLALRQEVSREQGEKFRQLVARRAGGEPLQYLTGSQAFMSLDFLVSPDVLVPRWDTERLVEEALRLLTPLSRPLAADVCTGSGAIAVSLAKHLPGSTLYAGDISPAALAIAHKNAQRHDVASRITFFQGDLLQPLQGGGLFFDLVTANPPYIPTAEWAGLPEDVRREPRLALDGGQDGLDFYRRLIPQVKGLLKPDGHLLLEIGWDQGAAVAGLCRAAGFAAVRVLKDYGGHDRVVRADVAGE